jgi:hypothetical protein
MADGDSDYEFGSGEDELARLERQRRALAPAELLPLPPPTGDIEGTRGRNSPGNDEKATAVTGGLNQVFPDHAHTITGAASRPTPREDPPAARPRPPADRPAARPMAGAEDRAAEAVVRAATAGSSGPVRRSSCLSHIALLTIVTRTTLAHCHPDA